METITSAQNKKIKELARLLRKKERDKTGLFLVEGRHMVEEAAKAHILKEVFLLEDEKIHVDVPLVTCAGHVLEKLSLQNSSPKIIGLCTMPALKPARLHHVLVLDAIQDPGNLGTLIRSALAFGMDAVVYNRACADPFNPKTLQASQGAAFAIPLIKAETADFIQAHSDLAFYAAALHTDSIALRHLQPADHCGIVIGNEGQGLSEAVLKLCQKTVTIEMAAFESLNAAIAGSIFMYYIFAGLKKD